jgi:hypothetical protein
MASNRVTSDHYEHVINIVRSWPAPQRLTFVQDVLATLVPDITSDRPRQPTLNHALGLLATDQPAPSDEDIAALLNERRQQRYGL